MKQLFLFTISFLLIGLTSQSINAKSMIAIEYDEVIICPSQNDNAKPPKFNEPQCIKTHASKIDPQNTAIWVKAKLNIPPEMQANKQPYSLYISGKTSSKAYFNNQYLGQNGTPSLSAKAEFPGKIDTMFYVQPSLIKANNNEVILLLSSHHGFIKLKAPLNFIGFGVYAEPTYYIQRGIWHSFIPLGALILGVLYFAVSCFSPYQRRNNILFLLMSSIAASQLVAELSRALFAYSYPFQDVRLLLIVSLSVAFGLCLLTYICLKFEVVKTKRWIICGALLTVIAVVFTPGFDPKTAMAILIPSLLSTTIIAIQAKKEASKEVWGYLAVFTVFTITIILTLSRFHDLLFYYIITAVLGFLFVQQALKLAKEQDKLKVEEQQVAKLQFKLEQNEQKVKPNKIKITSAGKIELISTADISYCKAAGDYVEVYLKDKKELLYSGNLKDLEKQLPTTFLRVHRSYIVNMDFIVSLKNTPSSKQKAASGSGLLLLEGSCEVPVSRRIMPTVRSAVGQA